VRWALQHDREAVGDVLLVTRTNPPGEEGDHPPEGAPSPQGL
jgi:hypothetical protein